MERSARVFRENPQGWGFFPPLSVEARLTNEYVNTPLFRIVNS